MSALITPANSTQPDFSNGNRFLDAADEGTHDERDEIKNPPAHSLTRRKTWPRLPPSINDIIYWDDGDAEEIGEGFFSNVYKLFHRPSGHTVVVKVSKANCADKDEDQDVMIKEIKLLKKLSHANIIKYLGLCAKDGKFHPVLEFINGGGLDRLLLDYSVPISWSEKIGFCRDVAKGMQYLHKKHVFHRDLKSSNCLIRHGEAGTRTVVVADFGLAREVTGDIRTPRKLSVVGTTFWMAPELLKGKLCNIKVDVFSYGILACEILARVISDPDDLPRTNNFGLDVEKFGEKCPDCPEQLMELVKDCTEVNNPYSRPGFDQILETLEELSSADDTSDYDVIESISSIDDDESNNNTISPRCTRCSEEDQDAPVWLNDKTTNITNKRLRHSGLSDDSGIGDCVGNICPNCKKISSQISDDDDSKPVNHIRDAKTHFIRRKKVSFKFVASLLSGRRRFKNGVIHEDVTPSKGMSLQRSASLPDLKNRPVERRTRSSTVDDRLSDRKSRAKSYLYDGDNS